MSEKLQITDEMEELSRLLDEMNAGHQPQCNNKDTAELLAIAGLLKKTGGPVCPPQHILDQTVDRALAGIHSNKPKQSSNWWYSGVLSTAAAVILVVGLNLLPSWNQQIPVPPQTTDSELQSIPQPKSSAEQPPTISQSTPVIVVNPPTTAPAAENQAPPSEPRVPIPTVPQVSPTESLKLLDTNKNVPIMTEKMKRSNQTKSSYLPSKSYLAASKNARTSMTPLTIPGQVPDLIISDKEQGVIRQIYHKGTLQEITITQRLSPQETESTPPKSLSPAMIEASEDKPDLINKVIITIFGQEVSLEGRQSPQELLKLAESLIP